MDNKEVRRLNLIYLVDEHGREDIARRCDWASTNYVTRMVNGYDNVGDKTVAKLTTAYKLPAMWMDTPHPHLWKLPPDQELEAFLEMLKGMTDTQLQLLQGGIAGIRTERSAKK